MVQTHNEKIYAYIGLTLLIVLSLVAIIGTSFHIRSYLKETTAIIGVLEDVTSSPNCSLELHIDGNSYRLYKDNRYSRRSFGVLDNMTLGTLENTLYSQIGKNVYLECVQVESNPSIVQLSIENEIFVSKDVAIHDFIGYESTIRTIWQIVMVVAVILLLLIWKEVIH